jgi:hypothetical protein
MSALPRKGRITLPQCHHDLCAIIATAGIAGPERHRHQQLMAHANRVLRSIETDDAGRCVDLFVRPDGSFGFEEYRRDFEDGRGWYPIGFHASARYETEDGALQDALAEIAWLRAAVGTA